MCRVLLYGVMALLLLSGCEKVAQGRDVAGPICADHELRWRTIRYAGANALWLMLTAHGYYSAQYEQIVTGLGAHGGKSAHLGHFRSTASSVGADCAVVEATPSDLQRLDLPLIAHLDKATGDYRDGGVFALVARLDLAAEEVVLIDPVTLNTRPMPLVDFATAWTGLALTVRPGFFAAFSDSWSALVGVAIMAMFVVDLTFRGVRSLLNRQRA